MAQRRAIFVLPSEEPLVESALDFRAGGLGRIAARPRALPPGASLDPNFTAVPIDEGAAKGELARFDPRGAPRFAVRGVIEGADPFEFHTAGDVQIFSDPDIDVFPSPVPGCGPAPIGRTADVQTNLDTRELSRKRLDGSDVMLAIMDTGINANHLSAQGVQAHLDPTITWSPGPGSPAPGNYPVGHGTMCAYDALIAAPRATLLDFPILQSRAGGGSPTAGLLSDALRAYSVLIGVMRGRAPGALVVSNSWGLYHQSWDYPPGHPGRYVDNPLHPFNLIVGALAGAGADILFAAGNCGAQCPSPKCQNVTSRTIMGANAHADVITVAGVTIKGDRVGYSSQGPGISGMAQQKPDLSAYTHFSGSRVYGPGSPDSGTSAACPVAAGAVAALRTRLPASAMAPQVLHRELRTDATRRGAPSPWNNDYGYGIIQPAKTAARLGL